jgi:hypothetical protein
MGSGELVWTCALRRILVKGEGNTWRTCIPYGIIRETILHVHYSESSTTTGVENLWPSQESILWNASLSHKALCSNKDEDIIWAIRSGFRQTHLAIWTESHSWPKSVYGVHLCGTTSSVLIFRTEKILLTAAPRTKLLGSVEVTCCEKRHTIAPLGIRQWTIYNSPKSYPLEQSKGRADRTTWWTVRRALGY